MSNTDVMVSVFCLAYNHEKYIRKTLEGFVKQKTDFRFEVLVHDDASTDSTADIIREFEMKYPDIIKPVYQTENQRRKRTGIIKTYLLPKAEGKYLAWCEGDDYWTDEHKLQIQVDALEQNPSCVACLSKVEKIYVTGEPLGQYIPGTLHNTGLMSGKEFVGYVLNPGIRDVFPVQISGWMMKRDIYLKYVYDCPAFLHAFRVIHIGDIPMPLFAGLNGDVYYIDRVMSHYRTGNPHSFVGRRQQNKTESAAHFRKKADAYRAFDAGTDYLFHDDASKAVQYAEFLALRDEHDLKSMKSEEYRWLYDSLSNKEKMKVYLFDRCPGIAGVLRNIKHELMLRHIEHELKNRDIKR